MYLYIYIYIYIHELYICTHELYIYTWIIYIHMNYIYIHMYMHKWKQPEPREATMKWSISYKAPGLKPACRHFESALTLWPKECRKGVVETWRMSINKDRVECCCGPSGSRLTCHCLGVVNWMQLRMISTESSHNSRLNSCLTVDSEITAT